jgi:protein KRI1
MDCDYDPANPLQNDLIEATKRKKKGKKWSNFAQAVAAKKPVFDSSSQTFDQYIDEYYKLDFEDIIGDMPCRFKYRNVMPNSFGLSIDEVRISEVNSLVIHDTHESKIRGLYCNFHSRF